MGCSPGSVLGAVDFLGILTAAGGVFPVFRLGNSGRSLCLQRETQGSLQSLHSNTELHRILPLVLRTPFEPGVWCARCHLTPHLLRPTRVSHGQRRFLHGVTLGVPLLGTFSEVTSIFLWGRKLPRARGESEATSPLGLLSCNGGIIGSPSLGLTGSQESCEILLSMKHLPFFPLWPRVVVRHSPTLREHGVSTLLWAFCQPGSKWHPGRVSKSSATGVNGPRGTRSLVCQQRDKMS